MNSNVEAFATDFFRDNKCLERQRMPPKVEPARWTVGAIALAILLGGCGLSDERLGTLVSDRAQYEIYTCDQLLAQDKNLAQRLGELDALMRKAEADTGGAVVNAVAYKPEYISVRGSLDQVRAVEADKKCEPPKPAISGKR
jgi:hypothetical protein